MTAEIAVFNKSAVALAADSAVTISGNNTYKINNGAEKLFALSKFHPIGVMVYGTGSLCGIPWEMIIKEFRKILSDTRFDTVKEYADEFWDFLCDCPHLIPEDIKENFLKEVYIQQVFFSLMQHVQENRIEGFINNNNRKPDITETYNIIEEECRAFLSGFTENGFFEGFNEEDLKNAYEFARPIAVDVCESYLFKEEGVELSASLIDALADVFSNITCRKSPFGNNTGIVIAGYGEKEYFPAILAFDVLGYFGKKIRMSPNSEKSNSGGVSGVTAYAQEDEVAAFMQGISGELQNFMFPNLEATVTDIQNEIQNEIQKLALPADVLSTTKQKLIDITTTRWETCSREIREYIIENHVSKVVEMIEFLPKQDLGYMAESLVNLTAFKRKVSNDTETVGGPIDVAIISKGDGFIWVKRKHYFDKELNHQYFKRT